MIPSRTLQKVALAWAVAGIAVAWWPVLRMGWLGLAGLLLLVVMVDFVWVLRSRRPTVSRRLPGRFAVGHEGVVDLEVSDVSARARTLRLFDGVPDSATSEVLPLEVKVEAGRTARVSYPLRMMERGDVWFSPVHVRMRSPLGLWWRGWKAGETEHSKVYPDYAPILRFALLAMDQRQDQMGIMRRSRAGMSRDFHQLRDYHEGDSLAQVDWKATARHRRLISRDFQEQRNQTVIFLLDTGRRMRAIDGELPQFDHCLNALLLVSYVALKQGDHVGVQAFGGEDRWSPPVKGAHSISALLNHLYAYQTSSQPSDFAEAAERLMMRQKRRCLVVVLTNLRGEDTKDLVPALRLIQTKHLVMVASLRERSIDARRDEPVGDFRDALLYAASERYRQERRRMVEELERQGVLALDERAEELPVALANRYLDLKQQGRL